MPDYQPFPIYSPGPGASMLVTLETAEPNMTVGQVYQLWGAAIDNAATPNPKPYALVADDKRHFKLVEFAKLLVGPPEEGAP